MLSVSFMHLEIAYLETTVSLYVIDFVLECFLYIALFSVLWLAVVLLFEINKRSFWIV